MAGIRQKFRLYFAGLYGFTACQIQFNILYLDSFQRFTQIVCGLINIVLQTGLLSCQRGTHVCYCIAEVLYLGNVALREAGFIFSLADGARACSKNFQCLCQAITKRHHNPESACQHKKYYDDIDKHGAIFVQHKKTV